MDFLTKVKRSFERSPQPIIEAAKSTLSSRIGDHEWNVREQLFLALLDKSDLDEAKIQLEKLEKQFPDSNRVSRLRGLFFEAKGRFPEAEEVYKNSLAKNPSNTLVQKRFTSLLIAQGKIAQAVKTLNDYLEIFQCDDEAWKQLGLLNIQMGNFDRATFCFGEVMLSAPQNYLSPLMYAELSYTCGRLDDAIVARKYFAHSLSLNKVSNVRALWGLHTSAKHVANANKVSNEEREISKRLTSYAEENLTKEYNDKAPKDIAILVSRMLKK